jgi:peptide/nickel transport system permease protein
MSTDAPDVLVVVEQDPEFIDESGERKIVARSPTQLFVMRFRRDRVAMTAMAFIVVLVVIAVLAPLIIKALGVPGPKVQNTDALDAFGTATGPTANHPFGVDQLGRDLVSRTIYGSRVSLEAAILGTGLAALIGTTVGLVAGFFGGIVDTLLSRMTDLVLAFPILLLGLGLAAACSGAEGCVGGLVQPGLGVVILVISLFTWPYIARIVRGQTLSLREKEFVEAARSLGASNGRIIAKDILPNLVAPLIVYTSLLIPVNILLEASLSFLGVGVQGGTPSWGAMIAEASGQFPDSWWYMLFPGLALLLTVLAFNLVGDGLQDALNPRGRK